MEIKVPNSQEEMDALRKSLRQEISEDALDEITGGNDHVKGKGDPTPWTCAWCGAVVMCKQLQDAAKHMTKCPNNSYK